MPFVIPGVIAVSTRKAKEHTGHHLSVREPVPVDDGYTHGPSIWCVDDQVMLAEELDRDSLPCGCDTQEEHDEGVRLQEQTRRQLTIPRAACVGCFTGDDGPTMHDCYIHR